MTSHSQQPIRDHFVSHVTTLTLRQQSNEIFTENDAKENVSVPLDEEVNDDNNSDILKEDTKTAFPAVELH